MSKGVNKVIIVGRLGQDPEVRHMPNGKAVANFTVATSDNRTDQQGQKQERTEWHRVVIYGKFAEIAGQYLHKGSKVYLEGKLQTREWQDQQGQKRYMTEIICHEMQMLDSRQNEAQPQTTPQPTKQNPASHRTTNQSPQQHGQGGYATRRNQPTETGAPPVNFDDDDTPF